MSESRDPFKREKDTWSASDWNAPGRSSWIWGIGLVLFGLIFLLQSLFQVRILQPWNFWAIFLIIPGTGMLVRAIEGLRHQGDTSGRVGNLMFTGILLILLGAAFLFGFGLNYILPVFLIVLGIWLVVTIRK